MNLFCRQEAVAVISGTSHSNRRFYDDIARLSGLPITALDTLLDKLANEDTYCHSVDDVSYRPSQYAPSSPSIPSGYGIGDAVLTCRDRRVDASDHQFLPDNELS